MNIRVCARILPPAALLPVCVRTRVWMKTTTLDKLLLADNTKPYALCIVIYYFTCIHFSLSIHICRCSIWPEIVPATGIAVLVTMLVLLPVYYP